MASRKKKHTETTTSEEQRKALVCVWFTPKVQLVNHLYTFTGCQRPENRLKKLQDICKWRRMKPADSQNRMEDSFNKVPEELKPEHGYH